MSATPRLSTRCAITEPQLDTLASALLNRETPDDPDAYQAAGIPLRARPIPQEPAAHLSVITEPGRHA